EYNCHIQNIPHPLLEPIDKDSDHTSHQSLQVDIHIVLYLDYNQIQGSNLCYIHMLKENII
ncbi:hypothetical protein C0J52_07675, partial [Blattella germanica]